MGQANRTFRPLGKVLFALLMIAAVCAFVELGSFFIYRLRLDPAQRAALEKILEIESGEENIKLRFLPHPYFNYINNPDFAFADGYKPNNSHGFRQPEWPEQKIPGRVRIVALGGSTTYGMLSRDGREAWPVLTEQRLNSRDPDRVEIINLGVIAYTTFEILGVTAMLVPTLQPDIVLIHCGVNDAFAAAYPDEGGPDNTRFRFQWNWRPLPSWKKFLMRRSYFMRLLGRRTVSSAANMPGDMIDAMQRPLPGDQAAWQTGEKADGRWFSRNLKTMIAIIRSFGALPVLIDHPLNPRWDRAPRPLYQVVVNASVLYNRRIEALGKSEGVPVISLYQAMRDPRFFLDAVHESAVGSEFKAELIAGGLEPLIQRFLKAAPAAQR